MVEQVDRDAMEALKTAFWASIMNANEHFKYLDYDSLDEIISRAWVGFEPPALEKVSAHRIAAEARGKEAAARIADGLHTGEGIFEQYYKCDVGKAIRASIGQEHSSEVERLRGLLAEAETCANNTLAAVDKYNDKNGTHIIGPSLLALGKLSARIRAALNGGQHG